MKTIKEFLSEKKQPYIKQDSKTGLWLVYVPSPTAKSGFIVQGEWKTEKEAKKDLKMTKAS